MHYISRNKATPCSWLSSFFAWGIFSGPNIRDRLSYHWGNFHWLKYKGQTISGNEKFKGRIRDKN